MESYWRSAPTAEDFEQLVDPDAKAPCESASNFGSVSILMKLRRPLALVSKRNQCHAICPGLDADPTGLCRG